MVVIMALLAGILVSFVSGQNQDKAKLNEKFAQPLREFESAWLEASLNQNKTWLERFFAGKLIVSPFEKNAAENRTREMAEIIDPKLKPEEIKVRITGNVTVLTNGAAETGENRLYYFLDTFNKRGGKWQVIASHSSIIPADEIGDAELRQTERELIKFEIDWAKAVLSRDWSVLERILAPDFVGVDEKGVTNKAQEITGYKESTDKITSAVNENVKVHIYAKDTAVVISEVVKKGLNKDGKEINRRSRRTDTFVRRSGIWQCAASQSMIIK
jgi:ketosteroid isomerase-like protein